MANTIALDFLRQQLASSASDGVRIEPQQLGQMAIAAVTEFERLQPCIQTPLPLIEQTVEQDNGRFEFVGGDLQSTDIAAAR